MRDKITKKERNLLKKEMEEGKIYCGSLPQDPITGDP